MKVITEGHRYELANFENSEAKGQELQFIEKVSKITDPTTLYTVNDGTTNEELLKVLINRIEYLSTKFPCDENAAALDGLYSALYWLNKRTENRKQRNVEGKALA